MRIRAVAGLGSALIGAGIGVAMSAGSASAAVPLQSPGVIAGVGLTHAETVAVANSPVPSVLGIGLLAPLTVVVVPEGSPTPRTEDGRVSATMQSIWQDMATQPNGRISVALVDPAQAGGKLIVVKQFL
ncbi:hypothetical protein ACW9HH_15060 [Nocardia gipuzkoensis]